MAFGAAVLEHLATSRGAVQLVVGLVAFLVVRQIVHIIYNLYFHPLSRFPGPKSWVITPIPTLYSALKGNNAFRVRDLHDKYGEVVRTGADTLSFNTAPAWKDIYGHGHNELNKARAKGIPVDTRKIISATPQDHPRFRKAMLPAFSDKALAQQEPLMTVYVDLLIKRINEMSQAGKTTNVCHWYNLTTFDLIADLSFGTPLEGLESGKSNMWLDNIHNFLRTGPYRAIVGRIPGIGLLVNQLLRGVISKALVEHEAKVQKLCEPRIKGHKQADRGDFMDYMMASRNKDNKEQASMTDEELMANSDLFMIAGSETTATLLSGLTYFFLKNPEAHKRAIKEVRETFASNEEINFVGTRQLTYLNACFEEALRVFPPAPVAFLRQVPEGPPRDIAGVSVPGNTKVGVHHLAAFHSEKNFHKAREFHPERWLPESTKNPSSPFFHDNRDVHKPFGFGPRDCIGRNLAYHEMRLIMSKVLYNFDMSFDEKAFGDWHNQPILILWSKPPLDVKFTSRF